LCAGCGSKVTGDALSRALSRLPQNSRADVLSRPGDDAAVLDLGARRQVLTTDHLRAFTADPELFARITAVHALGDVWAMGALPQAALANVILPRMAERLQSRTLAQILHAAADVFSAAGADLVGGHSTMGAEMTLGFTLTGLTDGMTIGHDGARAGDAIVLTRPVGTGAVLVAEMAGRARGADVMDMLHAMARPQGDAAAILRDAHAMTDVTGFGLAGHLGALCLASGLTARLELSAIPVYAGAIAAVEAGHLSVLHAANRRAAAVSGGTGPVATLLHDPQTAGGLLAAVSPAQVDDLLVALRAAGHTGARIGTFAKGPPVIRAV
ncbi:MAG: selenide, water dikinase SelD, partial [Jannaschia sp.]